MCPRPGFCPSTVTRVLRGRKMAGTAGSAMSLGLAGRSGMNAEAAYWPGRSHCGWWARSGFPCGWAPQSGRWCKVRRGMGKGFKGEGATGHRRRRGPSRSCLPAAARWITDVVPPDVLFRVRILKKVLGRPQQRRPRCPPALTGKWRLAACPPGDQPSPCPPRGLGKESFW